MPTNKTIRVNPNTCVVPRSAIILAPSTFGPEWRSDTDALSMPALMHQAVGGYQANARISERGADTVEIGPRLLGAGLQRGLHRSCEWAGIERRARGR